MTEGEASKATTIRKMQALEIKLQVYDPEEAVTYYYETKADKAVIRSSNRSRDIFYSIVTDLALKLHDELPFARKE